MRAVILSRSYHRRLRAATEALMASSARIDELEKKFNENERRYFAPLANEYRKMGDLERAIYICEQFLPQQPGHMSGHIVYGQALFESGRLDDARGVFETALSLDPENLIALRHLGDISARQGDPGAARRWYERVLEADPRNEEIQGLLAGVSDLPAGAHPQEREEPAPLPSHDWQPEAPELSSPLDDARDVPVSAAPALLDLEVALPGATPASPVEVDETDRLSDHAASSVDDIETIPDTAELMPDLDVRTEGFESMEFAAPPAAVEQAPGLQSAYDHDLELSAPAVAPLPGLEEHPGASDVRESHVVTSGLPELDESLSEDDGLVLPPHGDPIGATTAEREEPEGAGNEQVVPLAPAAPDAALLDFEMPIASEDAATASETHRDAHDATEVPHELPPEVIAAEAELIDAGDAAAAAAIPPSAEGPVETESIGSELSFLDVDAPSASSDASEETPPSDVDEPELETESTPTEEALEPASGVQRPFVTETMAELYLKQGFRAEALSVYEQLSAASPDDARLMARVTALRVETVSPAAASGPPVREFFARLAARRPGERAAAAAPPAEDDFASTGSDVWSESPDLPSLAPEPSYSASAYAAADDDEERERLADESTRDVSVAEQGSASADEPRSGGSIDALFGNRPASSTEDSAASALAQAFGGEPDTPPITGNPTRQATGELSLDSVFRDGGSRGPRTSQGFSFDQFFSQHPEGERTSGGGRNAPETPTEGEPAERTADDIEQFNAWLQGLKQR